MRKNFDQSGDRQRREPGKPSELAEISSREYLILCQFYYGALIVKVKEKEVEVTQTAHHEDSALVPPEWIP